jgi:hypothetical protein
MFFQFPQNCNGLIANLLLYRTNESIMSSLKEPTKVVGYFEQAKDLVKLGLEQLDMRYGTCVSGGERERGREGERERGREGERERVGERKTERDRERQPERERKTERKKERERQIESGESLT